MFAYSLFAIAIFLLVYIFKRNNHLTRSFPAARVTSLANIQATLSPRTSLRAQLAARAAPNTRLMRAFGIYSTFTTDSPTTHRSFNQTATGLITHHGSRYPWHDLAATARIATENHLPRSNLIAYDTLINIITLQVILIQLLGADPAHFKTNNKNSSELELTEVAFGINELWLHSKTGGAMPHLLRRVNAHLARWLPHINNPIELVVPAYETMWRVVAITVAFANRDVTHARPAFEHFMGLPDTNHFRARAELFSVEDFVREVLRLYPPTRHISRRMRVEDAHLPFGLSDIVPFASHDVLVKADIEAVQRDTGIWGPTAERFDPTRFHPIVHTDEQAHAWLPFGHGSLSCVAKHWAPHAAAVIAGAVLERVGGDSEFELVEGPELGGRVGWNGWIVREVIVLD